MARSRTVAYDTIKDLYKAGLVTKEKFERVKLLHSTKRKLPFPMEPVEKFTSHEIKKLRLREKLTPTEFALYLNTTLKMILEWEKGTKQPTDIEYKLLNVIMHKGLEAITYRTGSEDIEDDD